MSTSFFPVTVRAALTEPGAVADGLFPADVAGLHHKWTVLPGALLDAYIFVRDLLLIHLNILSSLLETFRV
jgi:hypothetical protein